MIFPDTPEGKRQAQAITDPDDYWEQHIAWGSQTVGMVIAAAMSERADVAPQVAAMINDQNIATIQEHDSIEALTSPQMVTYRELRANLPA
ncbi:hypothetical protein KC963_04955 [Candidatus Saccharibacteria bacterium]|nr:hypothetical protein [Candidatus Saccharibacteria bacterium]